MSDGDPLYGWSDEFSFTVIASDVAEISPASSLQPGQALTWPSIEGADAYEVFVSDISNGIFRFEHMKGLATNSVKIPEAWSEGQYRIWVRGRAAGKPSTAWSDPLVTEVRRRQVVQFESPTEGEVLFDGEVEWSWAPVEGAINYRVQWTATRHRTGIISEPIFDEQTAEITVTPIFPGDVFGQAVTRRINYYDHERVSFVSPATGDRVSGDSITITWDGPSSGWRSSYEIWVSNLTTGDVIRQGFINELSFPIPDLPTATGEYRYRVWLKVYDADIDWLPETLDFTYVVE